MNGSHNIIRDWRAYGRLKPLIEIRRTFQSTKTLSTSLEVILENNFENLFVKIFLYSNMIYFLKKYHPLEHFPYLSVLKVPST